MSEELSPIVGGITLPVVANVTGVLEFSVLSVTVGQVFNVMIVAAIGAATSYFVKIGCKYAREKYIEYRKNRKIDSGEDW